MRFANIPNSGATGVSNSFFRLTPDKDKSGGTGNSAYSLFPNPNEGKFSVRQAIPEDKTTEVKIYNALGMEMSREQVHFSNGIATFSMHHALPGLYLICIGEGNAKSTCLKFNIQ